ncbi:hypothetical protein NL676_031532 [Syzygium grande]|nr:hypothetical protein NL676_031532 [Syzygium grande]
MVGSGQDPGRVKNGSGQEPGRVRIWVGSGSGQPDPRLADVTLTSAHSYQRRDAPVRPGRAWPHAPPRLRRV